MSRSSLYYEPVETDAETLRLMRRMDEVHLEYPFFGSRMLTQTLKREGWMYPYLLRNLAIVRINQVWASGISYIPLSNGFAAMGLSPVERRFELDDRCGRDAKSESGHRL